MDGRPVLYRRISSLLVRSPHGNIVDKYVYGWKDQGVSGYLYMDMYFQGYREDRPIPGLKLRDVPWPDNAT